jgi:hypothetical protein
LRGETYDVSDVALSDALPSMKEAVVRTPSEFLMMWEVLPCMTDARVSHTQVEQSPGLEFRWQQGSRSSVGEAVRGKEVRIGVYTSNSPATSLSLSTSPPRALVTPFRPPAVVRKRAVVVNKARR